MKLSPLTLGLLLPLSACGELTDEQIAKRWPRPADVPESAILTAGEDGGLWADCRFVSDELDCDIYKIRGGLDFRQAYKVCVNVDPGGLAGGVRQRLTKDGFTTGWSNVVLVPTGAQQLANARPDLQQQVDGAFEEAQPLNCSIRLAPIEPE
jgi:hypothetical protein